MTTKSMDHKDPSGVDAETQRCLDRLECVRVLKHSLYGDYDIECIDADLIDAVKYIITSSPNIVGVIGLYNTLDGDISIELQHDNLFIDVIVSLKSVEELACE